LPLDPRVRRFLEVLGAGNAVRTLDPGVLERREHLAELMKLGGPAPPIGHIDPLSLPGPAGPLNARLYSPVEARAGSLPGILYLHGGGLVAGNLDTHACIAQSLAHFAACRVLALDYRLAPEHAFPASLDDAYAAVKVMRARSADYGIDPARLAICGDSAGGTLSAAVCQAALDHDLRHCMPGGGDPMDVRLSPLRAKDLAGTPPTLVHTAEFDPLRDEGRDYFERLAHTGTGLSYTCHPGMIHLFYGLGAVIPYARTALECIGHEIRAALA